MNLPNLAEMGGRRVSITREKCSGEGLSSDFGTRSGRLSEARRGGEFVGRLCSPCMHGCFLSRATLRAMQMHVLQLLLLLLNGV